MSTTARLFISCAAIAAALASPTAAAGVIDNALIQWRGHAEKCEDPRQHDHHAMVNVARA